jgi:dTDP-4-dehydrorhamnose 3,5-epimerase
MNFTETPLKGSYIIELTPYSDDRGWFTRTFCKKEFLTIRHDKEWVQINHSFTKNTGIIRGMHYQKPPYAEIKLVRCIAGKLWDVIVDIREHSDTFLQWFGAELSAENKRMMYIPAGFAHGFQTLSDKVELIYHHTAFYEPESEGGLRYDDPLLAIDWILPVTDISDRDRNHPIITPTFKGI